jgi:hypothetical protein
MEDTLTCFQELSGLYKKNQEWFNSNHKAFEKKYRSNFIAVIEPKNFIVDKNLDKLIKELVKRKKLNHAFITSIPPKGVASIL